jgi:DNA invertase Pin-like site-specific DNA recombinase
MIFGYSDNNDDVLINVDKMYIDNVRLKSRARPNLQRLIDEANDGDQIIVKSISHFGWGIRTVILMMCKLISKGVTIKDVNNYINTSCDSTFKIISCFRDIDSRRFQNVHVSKTKKNSTRPDKIVIESRLWNGYYQLWKNKGITKQEWGRNLGISPATFYRLFKEFKNQLRE